MKVTASIYFLGQYRPVYFEASTIDAALAMATAAILKATDREWFESRLAEARKQIKRESCAAWSTEHGCRGVSIAKRPHDPFLRDVVAQLPKYPGLDYSCGV